MKKRISIIGIIIAIGALSVAPLVLARPHRGGGPEFGGPLAFFGHLQKVKEELGLSDQQVDQIKAILGDVREQNAPYRDQLKGGMKDIAETLLENPNNVAAAQALLDQQTTAERAMKSNALNGAAKALAVLTAEQRDKLGTMLEQRHGRR